MKTYARQNSSWFDLEWRLRKFETSTFGTQNWFWSAETLPPEAHWLSLWILMRWTSNW